MCPKKAKTLKQRVRLYHRERLEKWFKEVARDVEKSSDKNMSTGVPTAKNSLNKKSGLEKKSRKQ